MTNCGPRIMGLVGVDLPNDLDGELEEYYSCDLIEGFQVKLMLSFYCIKELLNDRRWSPPATNTVFDSGGRRPHPIIVNPFRSMYKSELVVGVVSKITTAISLVPSLGCCILIYSSTLWSCI